jgi:hypothetical protein
MRQGPVSIVVVLLSALALSACEKKPDAPAVAAPEATAPAARAAAPAEQAAPAAEQAAPAGDVTVPSEDADDEDDTRGPGAGQPR